MDNFGAPYLQEKSVAIVQGFLDGAGSLDSLIAQAAEQDQLNPEQLKRLLETVNTLAFIKQLQTASDRTFEFPVASTEGVTQCLATPAVEKQARQLTEKELIKYKSVAKRKKLQAMQKKAEVGQEEIAMLQKAALQASYEHEAAFPYLQEHLCAVQQLRSELQKEACVSTVGLEKEDQDLVSAYVTFAAVPVKTETGSFVKSAALNLAKERFAIYKAASEFIEQYKTREEFLSTCLEKEALFSGMIGAGIRNFIAKPLGRMAAAVGKGAVTDAKLGDVYLRNMKVAKNFGESVGMTSEEAAEHLMKPDNFRLAEKHGFDVASHQKALKTAHNLRTLGGAAMAASVVPSMKVRNPADDVNSILPKQGQFQ